MGNELDSAIATLERRLEAAEQQAAELRMAINAVCLAAGMPARYADAALSGKSGVGRSLQIQDDTFYGKKLTPAMREYLEMRKAQGVGPAKPRDIYDALKLGGFQFEAKTDTVALVSLRALLRTQPHIFHQLPQGGTYGLTSWYPDAKRTPDAASGKKRGAAKKRAGRSKKALRASTKADEPAKQDETAPPNVVPIKDHKVA
jgi:hypothetical protein